MRNWYDGKKEQLKERKSSDDLLEETEMCDICGVAYHFTQVRRIPFVSHQGTLYRFRCCWRCSIMDVTKYL